LQKLAVELEKRLSALIEKIYALSGCQFNINSPKQLREILFEKLKLPVVKRTKTGPSTDEEVLRSLASQHGLAALLLEYRQITKLKTTYVDALPLLMDPVTCTIHTSFNQTATETGRLSSSNPNLQNMPIKTELGRTIRESVVAFDDKSYLLSCDYSQIELRVLAHMSKDEKLIEAFKQDKDIHKTTASLIYGMKEEEVPGEMRDTAKRVNFGIIYGLTSFGLARDLAISLGDAQNFIDAYFLRYPRVKEYVQDQIAKARSLGFVTTILGRRRYIPEINSKNQSIRQVAERQAINTPIQGSASDLIKLAMVRIHRDRAARQYKSSMILQIHDELLFNVSRDEAGVFEGFVKEAMETVLSLDVPIRVDMKRGKNWSEMEDTPLAIPNA
jgi:DNA polymerase-1